MATSFAQADDTDSIDLNEPLVMDSIGDQETSNLVEKARRVPFVIKEAKIRVQRVDFQNKSSEWIFKRLALQVAIGSDGVDTEGTSANRRLFPELLLAFNRNADQTTYDFDSDWYKKKARGPAKELFTALGFSVDPPPPVDQEFLDGLVGMEFIADIVVKSVDKKTNRKDDRGKVIYEPTGDFKNELINFRSA